MAITEAQENTNSWLRPLLIVLGVAIVAVIWFAFANKARSNDPTLTAAPPIAAPPGQQMAIHKKSPELLRLMQQQNGEAGMPTSPTQKP